MSESPTDTGPEPAYVEELNEQTQTTVRGSRQNANVAAKRTKPEVRKAKRDAASDSGYSSRTATTGGSLSQDPKPSPTTKNGLISRVRNMGKSKVKESSTASKAPPKKTLTRSEKKENLRIDTSCETREEAGRMRTSGKVVESVKAGGSRKQVPPLPPSPQASRTTAAPRPIPKPSTSRPASFHAPPHFLYPTPPHVVQVRYAPQLSVSTPLPYQQPPPAATYIAGPALLPTSPNRQIAYNFPPTQPQYIPQPQGWSPDGYYAQTAPYPHPPPLSRRLSVNNQQPRPLIVEYPPVRPQRPIEYITRRESLSHYDRPLIYHPATPDDEAIDIDDELRVRRVADRRSMPPPPVPERPKLSHSMTTSAMHKRPNRNSVEYVPHSSRSPHKQSFEGDRPSSKPPQLSRSSSNRNVPPQVTAPPAVPTARRRRPESYHGGIERVRSAAEAERYQEAQKEQSGLPLTMEAIRKVTTTGSSKTSKKSKGSDVGSKASTNSDARKRMNMERHREKETINIHIPVGGNMHINRAGMTISIDSREDSRQREGRSTDVDKESVRSRRQSVSSRRDFRQIKEHGERDPSQRRLSNNFSVQPPEEDDSPEHDELRRRFANLGVRHVIPLRPGSSGEDDDQEEPPQRAFNQHPDERLRRLRSTSQSRRSSRSALSAGIRRPVAPAFNEGEPF